MQLGARSETRRDKVVLLGQTSTGKTCLSNRIIQDTFNEMTRSTVGPASLSKTIEYNDIIMKLDIWDTGGSERYRSIAPMYYHDASAAIIVFDITSPESLVDAGRWINSLKQHNAGDIVIGVAANKIDINERKISSEDIEEFKSHNKVDFVVETSAKTGDGVDSLCLKLCAHLALKPHRTYPEEHVVVDAHPARQCSC